VNARHPLPIDLPTHFAVGDALARGVTPGRLTASDLSRPFHGVRSLAPADSSLETRCAAILSKMRPGDCFAGPTAALLWGIPLPTRLERDTRLHISSLLPTRALRRAGVVGSQRLEELTATRNGFPVTGIWSTCRAVAGLVSSDELVCAIDHAITPTRHRPALSSLDALDSYLTEHPHHPGVLRLRQAAARSRVGAWSPRETKLRLLLVGAGIPEPELNRSLWLPDGRELIPDLSWRSYRVAAEYNGAHHDDVMQREHDLRRIDDFTDIGWVTVNVERRELAEEPGAVIHRVARRLVERGWQPPRPLRVPKTVGSRSRRPAVSGN